MSVTGFSVFIQTDKDGVVILPAPVRGRFTAFVEQMLMGKGRNNLRRDTPLLGQISEHPSHCVMGGRQGEGLGRFCFMGTGRAIGLSALAIQQHGHGFRKAQSVKHLHEIHRQTAFFLSVIIPAVAADGDAMIGSKAHLPTCP